MPMSMAQTQAPMNQQMIGSFDAMSPEQLQEVVMRMGGSPQGQMAQQILARKRIMSTQQQPAQSQGMGAPQQYALGGMLESKGGVHFPERGIGAPSGLLHTSGPGRTDNLHIQPHADSYVLPADVVSGLGEGNSMAGAKAMDMALHSGPHGIPLPTSHRPIAKPPTPAGFAAKSPSPTAGFGLAEGGQAPNKVPIIAAGGEYIISPQKCAEIGGGDIKRGHRILDQFVLHVRKMTIKDMSKLKGPVRS